MGESPSPDRDSGGESPQSYAPYVDPELANDSGNVQSRQHEDLKQEERS